MLPPRRPRLPIGTPSGYQGQTRKEIRTVDTDILKTMVELVNDSVTALLALTDGVDYAQNHGHDMWAIARVTIFLAIFLSSNFLIRKAWKEREKWKDEIRTAEA